MKSKKEEETATKSESTSSAPIIVQMKDGDYMVHVYVEYLRSVKIANHKEIVFNAMMQLMVGEAKKYSSAKPNFPLNEDTPKFWGEHFFFELKKQTSESISSSSIKIKLLDKSLLFKDKLVGEFDIDVKKIYTNPDHAMRNQWIALTDPDGDSNRQELGNVLGLVMLSIAVVGPGDNAVKLEADPSKLKDCKIEYPTSFCKQAKQLSITIISAENLTNSDLCLGNSDAYIYCKVNDKEYQTSVGTSLNFKNWSFNEKFLIPLSWPPVQDKLKIYVYDKDLFSSDIIGTIVLSLKELEQKYSKKEGEFKWMHIYGSPISGSLFNMGYSALMNEDSTIASAWRGRVLIHISVQDVEAPKHEVIKKLDKALMTKIESKINLPRSKYMFTAFVKQGICLPDAKPYKVHIKIEDNVFMVDLSSWMQNCKHGHCIWNYEIKPQLFESPCTSVSRLEKIFVYLMDGNDPVCYWKGNTESFCEENPELIWMPLTNDKAIGKVKESHQAGLIQLKMKIAKVEQFEEKNNLQLASLKIPNEIQSQVYTMRCYIFQCKDLPQADETSQTDSYISVWNNQGKEAQTNVVWDSNNPLFYEYIDVEVDISALNEAHPIILQVWDSDADNESSSDFIGCVKIPLSEASIRILSSDNSLKGQDVTYANKMIELDEIPSPKWHDIKYGLADSFKATGQVLCSFDLMPKIEIEKVQQPRKEPDFEQFAQSKKFDVNITVMKLRNLESIGLLPIRKPYVQFMVKSLDKGTHIENVKTEAKSSGPDPVINQIVSFSACLPTNKILSPRLSCEVFDYICFGLKQPRIGTFTIDIGALITFKEQQLTEMKKLNTQCIQMLKRHVQQNLVNKMPSVGPAIKTTDGFESAREPLNNEIQVPEVLQDYDQENSATLKVQNDQLQLDEVMLEEVNQDMINASLDFAEQTLNAYRPATAIKSRMMMRQLPEQEMVNISNTPPIQIDKHQNASTLIEELVTLNIKDNKTRALTLETKLYKCYCAAYKNPKLSTKDLLAEINMIAQNAHDENIVRRTNQIRELLMTQIKQQEAELKQIEKKTKQHQQNLFQMKLRREQGFKKEVIIYPLYGQTHPVLGYKIETMVPPKDLYFPVGYVDLVKQEGKGSSKQAKHYRLYYNDELENVETIFDKNTLFYNAKIYRGQTRGLQKQQGFFSSIFDSDTTLDDEASNYKEVGNFIGFVNVQNTQNYVENQETLKQQFADIKAELDKLSMLCCSKKISDVLQFDIDTHFNPKNWKNFEHILSQMGIKGEDKDQDLDIITRLFAFKFTNDVLLKNISRPQTCIARLYVLEAQDLASRDIGSESDPYLFVTCGQELINTQSRYQVDESNPRLYEAKEFIVNIPGAPNVDIQIWDFDDLFGDDLIGTTSIDLNERWYNAKWRMLQEKPIETRELYHPTSSLSQGQVMCWLDLFDGVNNSKSKNQNIEPMYEIAPEPKKEYQLRICVFDAENFRKGSGYVDPICKLEFCGQEQETDTHWRCGSTKASWNYRVLFDFTMPQGQEKKDATLLKITLYDHDVVTKDEKLTEFNIDLELLIKDVRITQKPLVLDQKYFTNYFKDKYENNPAYPEDYIEFTNESEKQQFWLFRKEKLVEVDGSSDLIGRMLAKLKNRHAKIKLDIRCYPKEEAEKSNVGKAQSEPNHSPQLFAPQNRNNMMSNYMLMLYDMFPQLTPCQKLCCILLPLLSGILYLIWLAIPVVTMFEQMDISDQINKFVNGNDTN